MHETEQSAQTLCYRGKPYAPETFPQRAAVTGFLLANSPYNETLSFLVSVFNGSPNQQVITGIREKLSLLRGKNGDRLEALRLLFGRDVTLNDMTLYFGLPEVADRYGNVSEEGVPPEMIKKAQEVLPRLDDAVREAYRAIEDYCVSNNGQK